MILLIFGLAFLLGVILFFILPPRRAAIACLIGGWALLPTAQFASHALDDPALSDANPFMLAIQTGIGSALIGPTWLTRSTVIGMTVIVGMLLADAKSLRRLKPHGYDIPMAIWCIAPLISGLYNQLPMQQTLLNLSYQTVAWGGPYIAGRLYFSDLKPLRELGIGLVIAGLCYAPLCLIEAVFGPMFYELLYQYHPYRFDGIERAIGYRPIVFLEHGSQLGIWMPAIALVAFWMHMCGALPRLKVIPSHVAVLVLIVTAVICQSLGGVALMVIGIIAFALLRRGVKIPKPVWIVLLIGVLGMGGFAAGGDKALAKVIGKARVDQIKNISRLKSMGWRINAIRRGMDPVKDHPIFGTGRWDWWQLDQDSERPVWSLFAQGLGEYGVIAALALLGVFLVPVWQFIRGCPAKLWTDVNLGSAAALTVFLLMHFADSLLNPTFSTSLICVAGGLNTIGPHLKRALKSA